MNERDANQIVRLMDVITKVAREKQEDAAHYGSMDDGGGSSLLGQVRFYQYGMRGEFPPEWERFKARLEAENNPEEVLLYRRLREKYRDLDT